MANDLSNVIREVWLPEVQEESRDFMIVKDVADFEVVGDGDTFHKAAYTGLTTGTYTRNALTSGAGAVTQSDVTTTDEALIINQSPYVSWFTDALDKRQMYAQLDGKLKSRAAYSLAQAKNTALFQEYANAASVVDNADLGGAAGAITPDTTNILDILENFKAKTVAAAGTAMIKNFWLAVDSDTYFKVLERAMTSYGYRNSDKTIQNGFKGELLDIKIYMQPKSSFTTTGSTTHWLGGYTGAVTFKVQEGGKYEVIKNPKNADGSTRLGEEHIVYDLYGKKTYSDGARELTEIEVTV